MITIKEEWLLHEKTQRAIAKGGHEVVTLWLAIKRYCACNLTDGFVPDEDIECLPGAPAKPRKALKALVECGSLGRDGVRGSGLVDPATGGWQLHDYDDHAKSREEIELAREKARAKKERQRQAARQELERLRGSRDRPPDKSGPVPEVVPGAVPGGQVGSAQEGHLTHDGGGLVYARDPQPSPTQPNPAQAAAQLPEHATPRTLAAALRIPIRERARLVLAKKHEAQHTEPHNWPEVQDISARFSNALGWARPRFGATTQVTLGIVALLAEFESGELDRAIAAAPSDPWLTSGRKGLGSLTVEVVTCLLNPLNPPRPKADLRGPVQPSHGSTADFLQGLGFEE